MTAKYVVAYSGSTVSTTKPAGSLGLMANIPDRGAQGTGNFKKPKTRPNGFMQTVVIKKASSR